MQALERDAPAKMRLGHAGLERDGAVEIAQRFHDKAQRQQRVAAIVARAGGIGTQRQHGVEIGARFGKPAQMFQRGGAAKQGAHVAGRVAEIGFEGGQRLVETALGQKKLRRVLHRARCIGQDAGSGNLERPVRAASSAGR